VTAGKAVTPVNGTVISPLMFAVIVPSVGTPGAASVAE
jgi:hypothetical protein